MGLKYSSIENNYDRAVHTEYAGGITGALSDYVTAGSGQVKTAVQAVLTEDTTVQTTVTGTQTTAAHITDLNALAESTEEHIKALIEF